MAANFIAEFRRSLNVNQIAYLYIAQVGNAQRLFHQVEANLVAIDFRDR